MYKLVIDSKGSIAAWTDNGNGGELSYDLDAVTYLEEFIKQYPDFSVRGVKGIITLTGYECVLGYNTHQLNAPENQEDKHRVLRNRGFNIFFGVGPGFGYIKILYLENIILK
ncbi:MAG: hypothetical protein FWD40_02945 [Treponema sp.]|nr:hypothetical protein [Treponema sp.]